LERSVKAGMDSPARVKGGRPQINILLPKIWHAFVLFLLLKERTILQIKSMLKSWCILI